ncbi:MAG: glycoside hydrolase family 13 protein [Exiguobacterium oxidotolerans]
MNKQAVFHRAMSPYVYKYDQETVHIRLTTAKGDVDRIILIHGDPYEWDAEREEDRDWNFDPDKEKFWKTQQTPMMRTGADATHDYWFVAIKPSRRRVRYGFELSTAEETAIYTERGWYDEIPLDHPGYYFAVPYINAVDVFDAPAWVKETVWYQIFPDRFANGDVTNDRQGTVPWASEAPAYENHFGGDFQGVIDNIGYLKNLGINGIYFCPVFAAPSNHKYDTLDYLKLDPAFGTEEKFREMVELLHANGIRVLLDAVFNHVSVDHPTFQDVIKRGADSEYADWFMIDSFPIEMDPPNYEVFAFEANMPKLNTANADVKAYLLKVGRYWVEEFGIDGWRLDVASEVDHAFWRDFRKEVRTANPEAYIVGECWTDSQEWLFGDQFDAVMNYGLTEAFLTFFATRETTASEFSYAVVRNLNGNAMNVNEVMFNLVGSHDTPRALTRAGGDKERMRLLLLSLLTFTGSPVIYYGDEIGMTGGQDPANRKCMEWDQEKQDTELLSYVTELIALRKAHPALANEASYVFEQIDDEKNQFVIRRSSPHGDYLILINNGEKEARFEFSGRAVDLLDGTEWAGEINVGPIHGTILQIKNG